MTPFDHILMPRFQNNLLRNTVFHDKNEAMKNFRHSSKYSWMPIVLSITAAVPVFFLAVWAFGLQRQGIPSGKTKAEIAADTEGSKTYAVNRDTTVFDGKARLLIRDVIVRKTTVLVIFSIENHFAGAISTIEPYLIDHDNANQRSKFTNRQQFVDTRIEPQQAGGLVAEFDHAAGAARHFTFGFTCYANGSAFKGEAAVPFSF